MVQPGPLDRLDAAIAGSFCRSGTTVFWRHPTVAGDISRVPKTDAEGIAYTPVRAGEERPGEVLLDRGRLQRSGVRTAFAGPAALGRQLRVPGIVKPDERTVQVLSLRADGFIETLHVNETGRHVVTGEPLFRVYSPEMTRAQANHRIAITSGTDFREAFGAMQRLRNLAIPNSAGRTPDDQRPTSLAIDWPSPVTGVVMEKKVVQGQMVRAGEEIFRFADPRRVWVIADVPEQELSQVAINAPAIVTFRAFPDERFSGRVTFVAPELDRLTRTAKARVEIANDDLRLRYEMYGEVEIGVAAGGIAAVTIPLTALIESRGRQVVLVDRGGGRFEPRSVVPGRRSDSLVEVRNGLSAGDAVVVSAAFLIDGESSLSAEIDRLAPLANSEPAMGQGISAADPAGLTDRRPKASGAGLAAAARGGSSGHAWHHHAGQRP